MAGLDENAKNLDKVKGGVDGLLGSLDNLSDSTSNAASKILSFNLALEGVKRASPVALIHQLRESMLELYRVTGLSSQSLAGLDAAFRKLSESTRYYSSVEVANVIKSLNQGIHTFQLFGDTGLRIAENIAKVYPKGGAAIASTFSRLGQELPHVLASIQTKTINVGAAFDIMAKGGAESAIQYVKVVRGMEDETLFASRGMIGSFDTMAKNISNAMVDLGMIAEKVLGPFIGLISDLSNSLKYITPMLAPILGAIGGQLGMALAGKAVVGTFKAVSGMFGGGGVGVGGASEVVLEQMNRTLGPLTDSAKLKETIKAAIVEASTRTQGLSSSSEETKRKTDVERWKAEATAMVGVMMRGVGIGFQAFLTGGATAAAFGNRNLDTTGRLATGAGALLMGGAANISSLMGLGQHLNKMSENFKGVDNKLTVFGQGLSNAGKNLTQFSGVLIGAITTIVSTVIQMETQRQNEMARINEQRGAMQENIQAALNMSRAISVATKNIKPGESQPLSTGRVFAQAALQEVERSGLNEKSLQLINAMNRQLQLAVAYSEAKVAQEHASVELNEIIGAGAEVTYQAYQKMTDELFKQVEAQKVSVESVDKIAASLQQQHKTLPEIAKRFDELATSGNKISSSIAKSISEGVSQGKGAISDLWGALGLTGEDLAVALATGPAAPATILFKKLGEKILGGEQLPIKELESLKGISAEMDELLASLVNSTNVLLNQETERAKLQTLINNLIRTGIQSIEVSFSKAKQLNEIQVSTLEARKRTIKDLYLPEIFAVNLTVQQLQLERQQLEVAKQRVTALDEEIANLAGRTGMEKELQNSTLLRAKAVEEVAVQESKVASLLAQTRRTWMESMQAVSIGLPTGGYILGVGAPTSAFKGPAWFPGAQMTGMERAAGMGTFQSVLNNMMGGGGGGMAFPGSMFPARNVWEGMFVRQDEAHKEFKKMNEHLGSIEDGINRFGR